jgi:hypothetical protein
VAKHEENGEMITHYLVKWKSLNYEDSTWELEVQCVCCGL